MIGTPANGSAGELKAPVRNRYFYGKMLDVFHFELEQGYFNEKRWLINQRVIGYGVVCGLDVTLGRDNRSVVVSPGIAIDRCGREIIVASPSHPVSLDPWMVKPSDAAAVSQPANAEEAKWLHVCLCYHECESDPEPAFGNDCDTSERCASGSIRERYRIDICEGRVKVPQPKCNLADLFSNRTIDYAALARYVTRACPPTSEACCIPIANIQLPQPPQPPAYANLAAGSAAGASGPLPSIDIAVRPIVLTNPLLYQLLICLCGSGDESSCGPSY